MELRNRNTGAVITESEFRSLHKNTSFPAQIRYDEWGYDIVFDGPQATVGRYQVASRDGVEQVNGKWYTKWSVAEMNDEAKAATDAGQANGVRLTRNQMLRESDWTQVADAPVDIAEWAIYRQALRDVPKQSGFPWEVIWPQKPE